MQSPFLPRPTVRTGRGVGDATALVLAVALFRLVSDTAVADLVRAVSAGSEEGKLRAQHTVVSTG